MYIINTLLPIFLIIVLGMVLRRANFFNADFVKGLNKMMYWVGLPALLFYKVALAQYNFATVGKTFTVVFGGMIACIILGYLLCRLWRIESRLVGTMVQSVFRGNLAYIGLPVIIYSFFNVSTPQANAAESLAVMVLAFIVPFYNIAAVIVLLLSRHQIDRTIIPKITKQIITNPLVLSCVLGYLVTLLPNELPRGFMRSMQALGNMALPLALISIGAALAQTKIGRRWQYALVASLLKIIAAPLAGWLIGLALNLGPDEMRVALLYLACPTAIASYVLADQLGGDSELAATTVIISSLLCVIPMIAILYFFQS